MTSKEVATICSPITNLSSLLDVSLSCLTNRFNCSPLVPRHTSPKQKVLLCHDMKGGYLEDKHTQGCQTDEPCYRFFRWHLIDIFVYFTHELVTIPPLVWIDCAHDNGVQILGTFITEFDKGKEICRELLESEDNIDRAVDALALLMAWYKFDGYLLNIENPIESDSVARLLLFVTKLKSSCANIDPNSLVIWYDSVTINGELKWQNQLNEQNQPFFDACDGIFLNYTWKPELLLQSRISAGQRHRDVFVGIDVFGRGCFGGGGFDTSKAMSISSSYDLSTALFAPGWIFENLDTKDFIDNDKKFWDLLEPYTNQKLLDMKWLTTYFSDGFGNKFFIHGSSIVQKQWYNLSLQSCLPNVQGENEWLINYDDAYFGGSCIDIKTNDTKQFKLFKCLIPIDSECEVVMAFKHTEDVLLELTFDNGENMFLELNAHNVTINEWRRKMGSIRVPERRLITGISIRYAENTHSTIQLGFLSIRPHKVKPVGVNRIHNKDLKIDPSMPIVQTIENIANSSIILHFVDSIHENPTSMILVFVRDRYERCSFLGATRQSYFVIFYSDTNNDEFEYSMILIRNYSLESLDLIDEQTIKIPIGMELNISNLEICCLAYDKQFDQVKAKIELDPQCVKIKDRDGRTVLHWACSSGAKDIVQYLLDVCHVRPDISDELGWTPLMIAVSTGHTDIVRMLLKTNKVDVEQSNSSGARPLHYACSKNFYEIVQLLIEHDADVNAIDKYKQTPLDRCCSKGHTQIVELLLKHPKIDVSMHKECDGDHSLSLFQK